MVVRKLDTLFILIDRVCKEFYAENINGISVKLVLNLHAELRGRFRNYPPDLEVIPRKGLGLTLIPTETGYYQQQAQSK
jgi:hypothetical protein